MKKYALILLLFCTTSLFGQDVSESLAVAVATRYYERVKDDNIHLLNPVAYTIRQDSAWMDDKDAKELRGVI